MNSEQWTRITLLSSLLTKQNGKRNLCWKNTIGRSAKWNEVEINFNAVLSSGYTVIRQELSIFVVYKYTGPLKLLRQFITFYCVFLHARIHSFARRWHLCTPPNLYQFAKCFWYHLWVTLWPMCASIQRDVLSRKILTTNAECIFDDANIFEVKLNVPIHGAPMHCTHSKTMWLFVPFLIAFQER